MKYSLLAIAALLFTLHARVSAASPGNKPIQCQSKQSSFIIYRGQNSIEMYETSSGSKPKSSWSMTSYAYTDVVPKVLVAKGENKKSNFEAQLHPRSIGSFVGRVYITSKATTPFRPTPVGYPVECSQAQ